MNLDVGFSLPGCEFPHCVHATCQTYLLDPTCVSSHHPADLTPPLGSLDSSCSENEYTTNIALFQQSAIVCFDWTVTIWNVNEVLIFKLHCICGGNNQVPQIYISRFHWQNLPNTLQGNIGICVSWYSSMLRHSPGNPFSLFKNHKEHTNLPYQIKWEMVRLKEQGFSIKQILTVSCLSVTVTLRDTESQFAYLQVRTAFDK